MKALVKYALGREGMGVLDVPEPVPQAGELKVKVLAAGICGGDIHSMLDERVTDMPVILGHEYVGQVVETCGDVGDFQAGDYAVTLPACYGCGHCDFCKAGLVTLCPERKSIGTHRNGAMAEYLVVPAKYSFKVPADAEDKIAYALSEPFICTVRGVYERVHVEPGDLVVVSGPGPMGLLALQALKTRGAYVIVSGLKMDQARLEMAKQLGADAVADHVEALEKAIRKVKPAGADLAVEAGCHPSSLKTCLDMVKVGGSVLVLGTFGGHEIPLNFDITHVKELSVFGSNSTAVSSWEIGMALINEKKVDLSPLVSMRLPLSQWQRGFDAVIRKEAYKVVFCPDMDTE